MNDLNLFLLIVNLSITVFAGAVMVIIPLLTRKAFLFGVRIPEEGQKHQEQFR